MTQATRPTLVELEGMAERVRDGDPPAHPDDTVNEAALLIAAASGKLALRVARAAGSIDFHGWFSRAGAVLAAEVASGDRAPELMLAVLPAERLAGRIAELVELGPRPDSAQELQLVIGRPAYDGLLSGTLPGGSAAISSALGLPEGELVWAAEAFAAEDLTHWTLTVEGVGDLGARIPAAEIDVVDAPASSVWLALGGPDLGEVVLVSTTPRAIWATLTTILPCWDGVDADADGVPA